MMVKTTLKEKRRRNTHTHTQSSRMIQILYSNAKIILYFLVIQLHGWNNLYLKHQRSFCFIHMRPSFFLFLIYSGWICSIYGLVLNMHTLIRAAFVHFIIDVMHNRFNRYPLYVVATEIMHWNEWYHLTFKIWSHKELLGIRK